MNAKHRRNGIALPSTGRAGAGGDGGDQVHTVVRLAAPLVLGAALLLMMAPLPLAGQDSGRIVGKVVDERTGEALSGAQVSVARRGVGALTDLSGRYSLNRVPSGVHSLAVQLIGYGQKTVTGVEVVADRPTIMNLSLSPRAIALQEITVSAAAERGSTTALLSERRKAGVVMDAIGEEQIARSPDGDAAAVLARSPGVSVVDDRYVYVRGLGERYGNATLNGAPMASSEPDRKVVPLDIIPSDFIESIVTTKTFSPDQPGDYAGGLVQIRTRDFPATRILRFSGSGTFDTETTFKDGLHSAGGGLDFLGFDDGFRDLPGLVPADRRLSRGNFTPEQLARIGKAFGPVWGPQRRALPLEGGFKAVLGDEHAIGDNALGYLATVNYANAWGNKTDLVERVFSLAGLEEPEVDYTGTATAHSVALGGMAQLSYNLSPTHRLTTSAVYNHVTLDEARILEGFNLDTSADRRNTRLQYVEQSLMNGQLKGQHELLGARVEWRGDYKRSERYEPNTREVLYRDIGDGRFAWDQFIQSGSIFHQDMTEDGYGGALDIRIPFGFRGLPATFVAGGLADTRVRDTFTRRFRFLPAGNIPTEVRLLDPDRLFSPENIGPHMFEIQEATFRADNYDASQDIYAAYGMFDLELLPGLRAVTGVRVEWTDQWVQASDLFDGAILEPLPGALLDDVDVLPSLNLTYGVSDRMNVRLGASRTVARPYFRELAPLTFADYAGGYLTVGNPTLARTLIRNLDVRWEWFPELGSLVAVSGFYKEFDDPIEVLVFPSSEFIRSWINADEATNFGAELELRAPLAWISPALDDLALNWNLTLVDSEVATGGTARIYVAGSGPLDIDVLSKERPLQGQSMLMTNLGLTYSNEGSGTAFTALYNRFSDRIASVGTEFLDDIVERGRHRLDLVLEQAIGSDIGLKLSAKRLLGNEVEFTQGGDVLRAWTTGRELSLSFSWGAGGS